MTGFPGPRALACTLLMLSGAMSAVAMPRAEAAAPNFAREATKRAPHATPADLMRDSAQQAAIAKRRVEACTMKKLVKLNCAASDTER